MRRAHTTNTLNLNEAWPHFFAGFSLESYPELIKSVTAGVGRDSNGTGVSFPADIAEADPTEAPLPPDMVEIYCPGFDDSIIPQATFYQVLQAFAEQLLERPGQPAAWYEAMRVALNKLGAKTKADETA